MYNIIGEKEKYERHLTQARTEKLGIGAILEARSAAAPDEEQKRDDDEKTEI